MLCIKGRLVTGVVHR